jgi:hypothetical protein
MLKAAVERDAAGIEQGAIAIGYLGAEDPADYRAAMVTLVEDAVEPARSPGGYHFGRSDLARRMSEKVLDLRLRQRFGRLPPPGMLFLHRRLGGLYLLFSHLSAEVPVQELVARHTCAPFGNARGAAPAPDQAPRPPDRHGLTGAGRAEVGEPALEALLAGLDQGQRIPQAVQPGISPG